MTAPTRITLAIEPLTPAAFRPFGDVIEASEQATQYDINEGWARRFHDLARIDTGRDGGHPLLSVFRARARPLPLRLSLLERHRLGSQAFVALAPRRFLVVVAPAGPQPDAAQMRCFLAAPGQGVNYAAGTWHHPLLAIDEDTDFLVVDRGGPEAAGDCEEWRLDAPAFWVEA
jgi:ureidoglycolate lyase